MGAGETRDGAEEVAKPFNFAKVPEWNFQKYWWSGGIQNESDYTNLLTVARNVTDDELSNRAKTEDPTEDLGILKRELVGIAREIGIVLNNKSDKRVLLYLILRTDKGLQAKYPRELSKNQKIFNKQIFAEVLRIVEDEKSWKKLTTKNRGIKFGRFTTKDTE